MVARRSDDRPASLAAPNAPESQPNWLRCGKVEDRKGKPQIAQITQIPRSNDLAAINTPRLNLRNRRLFDNGLV